jgi:hypothetical protein
MSATPATLETLLAALNNAQDDTARAALLAASPPAVVRAVHARLAYRRLLAESDAVVAQQDAADAEFSRRLTVAAHDAARLTIISGAEPEFLRGWRERRAATESTWRRRYLERIGALGP